MIQSEALQADAPEFVAATRAVVAALGRESEVTKIRSPLDSENAGQISKDGHSAIVEFQIRGDADLVVDRIDPILLALAGAQTAHPGVLIGTFGDASVDQELEGAFMDDLKKAGVYSVPITLIILIVVFGALVAAGIPLLLALTAVIATFGLWAIPSHVWPSDESLYAMVLLIGLAVGVDYSMFYLKREREERAAGRSPAAALDIAASTSGRSVLISGATVIIAMAGMLFAGDTFAPFGVATMIVVAVAVVGSLTVLPAVLASLGDNVDRLRVPSSIAFDATVRRVGSGARSSIASWPIRVSRPLCRPGCCCSIAAPALTLHRSSRHRHLPQGLDVLKTSTDSACFPQEPRSRRTWSSRGQTSRRPRFGRDRRTRA